MYRPLIAALAIAPLFLACSGDDDGTPAPDPQADAGAGIDASVGADAVTEEDTVVAQPLVPEFGADGEGDIVAYVGPADGLRNPRTFAFNPVREGELWIFNREDDAVIIVTDAGTENQTTERRYDAFANHFLEETAAVSFDDTGFFGSCGETRNTYDGQAAPNDFMGPALWTTDLDIFARVFQDPFGSLLGSHMDMLHSSPNCMGIAWDSGNIYWVFDGHNGDLVYYDFAADHGPGEDDHSDATIRRFPEVQLTRVPDVPGHMMVDQNTRTLYINDTGTGRILWVNVDSGEFAATIPLLFEPLAEYSEYRNVEWGVFAEGLDRPSGMTMNDERLFIGEYGTGQIVAYDIASGDELGRFDTRSEGLMGLTFDPQGSLWFTDNQFNEAARIE